MNLQLIQKVKYNQDESPCLPTHISLFCKYFIYTDDNLWVDMEDKYKYKFLSRNKRYADEIESEKSISKLFELRQLLEDMEHS
jgi:hypothetical protein